MVNNHVKGYTQLQKQNHLLKFFLEYIENSGHGEY